MKFYVQLQLVLALALGFYIYHHYQKNEPVTRLIVDSTWKLISTKIGLCDSSCYQAWQQKMQSSPETHIATQKIVRWVTSSPKATRFVVDRISPDQKKQLMMLVTLSESTPEGAQLFESTYGIAPSKLKQLLR